MNAEKENLTMESQEQTLPVQNTGESLQGNMPPAAKLLGKRTHQMPGKLSVSELFFEVPKNYSKPQEGNLCLFARSAERFEKPVDTSKKTMKQPPWRILLFLQGTGLSSTVTARTLATEGGPAKQAALLKNFRADSIVMDCEAVRNTLTATYPAEEKKWSIMGVSFGGFCCGTYLSKLSVFISAGLPPLILDTSQRGAGRLAERNKVYYEKYKEDVHRVKDIIRRPTRWSADRVMSQLPNFQRVSVDGPEPVLFTGEMIFRDMFKDYDELRELQETADLLAHAEDWPELYDEQQLAKNEVPIYSAVYIEDMLVHFDLSRDAASKINNCKTFMTNNLYHEALFSKSNEVMKQLFALRDDVID
ncbi:MAG: hypothetical protein ASARMPRED_008493 [Alectoria sarmentosa]|nr:MAG: hypothetical protein ASARMPRED_008493 [Alectoria sarmentosa]